MSDLTPEEHKLAQVLAYEKSLARGNGIDAPAFDHEASIGDFWQAAGDVIAHRNSTAFTNHYRCALHAVLPFVSGLSDFDSTSGTRDLWARAAFLSTPVAVSFSVNFTSTVAAVLLRIARG